MRVPCWPAQDPELYRLLYSASMSGSTEAVDEKLANIMAASLKNNPKRGITGALFYDRDQQSVLQVIEGPEDEVCSLFATIEKDPRHSGCKVIRAKSVPERMHKEFGMVLIRTSQEKLAEAGLPLEPPTRMERAVAEALFEAGLPVVDAIDAFVRLQYSARSTAVPGSQAFFKDLSDILQASVANNPANNICGLLCVNPKSGEVFQVLEGTEQAVISLFHKISEDSRCTDVRLTNYESIGTDRYCLYKQEGWGMVQKETTEDLRKVAMKLHHEHMVAREIPVPMLLSSSVANRKGKHGPLPGIVKV